MPGKKRVAKPESGTEPRESKPKSAKKAKQEAALTTLAGNSVLKIDANAIPNKEQRMRIKEKQKTAKRLIAKEARKKRQADHKALGDKAPDLSKQQKTIESMREVQEDAFDPDDEEVKGEQDIDEWSKYFKGEVQTKTIITTNYRPTKRMYEFMNDLLLVFPKSYYFPRRNYQIKKVIEYSKERGFTDILVVNEDRKTINALTHVHLPDGPTAHYKLSSLKLCSEIPGRGKITSHQPEVMLNNFSTRLGHRVGRMLGSLFHQEPEFKGRRVCTFHNQRDFIFFRHHRYVFDSVEKARVQELGPEFTLKLKWLQHGTFDTKFGEYEWLHKKEMGQGRKDFFL
jgi:ribosome production factor 1